jgi:hypothetical protein
MTSYSITINNEKIWKFYNEHQSLDFENTNLIFIDIMSKLLQDTTSSSTTNNILHLVEHMKNIQSQIKNINDNFSRMQEDTSREFTYKLSEFKKEYIEDVKVILTNNVAEKFAPLIKEQNAIVLDKTHLLINDILSKNKDDTVIEHINDAIKLLNTSISEETNKLISNSINKKTFDDFISNIESKFTSTLQNSQSIFSSTEQRLDTSIRDIKLLTENKLDYLKDISTSTHQTNSLLNQNVSDLLKKMEVSTHKGKISENIVYNILLALYPSAQIEQVGTQKETGDIILTRNNKATVLVEVKNWTSNVSHDEVKKFIFDVEKQNCCGLFLSQNCGIANKENFEINVHNGNVLLYVHQANNDSEKIKMAINIIDHFKNKLDELDDKSEVDTISKEILEKINKEYQYLSAQKLNMIKFIKDSNSKIIKQLEEFNIPTLDDYLSKRFAFSVSKYVCEYCEYVGKNQQSMSAHYRGCAVKKNITHKNLVDKIETLDKIIDVDTDLSENNIDIHNALKLVPNMGPGDAESFKKLKQLKVNRNKNKE